MPSAILERFQCSETDSNRWVALRLKDAEKISSTNLRIAKYLKSGILAFSIGATEFGRALGLDTKIRAIISGYKIEVIEVKSSNGKNTYPGFMFHVPPAHLASRLLDGVIAAVRAGTGAMGLSQATSSVVISWAAGEERIDIDFDTITEHSVIERTIQHIDEDGEDWIYKTTSRINVSSNGEIEIKIHYDPLLNPHIPVAESWWGTTILVLKKGQVNGKVRWIDDNLPQENVESAPFEWVQTETADLDKLRDFDDLEIESRLDLESTDKQVLTKARRGQGLFRARVMKLEKFCRVTGTSTPMHLRASHIKPWAVSLDNERLDGHNGLMLAPHIDHLFDRAFISFDERGSLLVLNDNVFALLHSWGIDANNPKLTSHPFSEKQCAYLRIHRQRFEALRESIKG